MQTVQQVFQGNESLCIRQTSDHSSIVFFNFLQPLKQSVFGSDASKPQVLNHSMLPWFLNNTGSFEITSYRY